MLIISVSLSSTTWKYHHTLCTAHQATFCASHILLSPKAQCQRDWSKPWSEVSNTTYQNKKTANYSPLVAGASCLVRTQCATWKKNRLVHVCLVYDQNFTFFFFLSTVCERDPFCHCSLLSHTHQCHSISFVYASCCGQQSRAHWQSYLSHSLNTLDRLWGWGPAQNMCLRTAILTHGNRRQGRAFSHGHLSAALQGS